MPLSRAVFSLWRIWFAAYSAPFLAAPDTHPE